MLYICANKLWTTTRPLGLGSVVIFIAQGDREQGKSCVICLECDHVKKQWTLYSPSSPVSQGGVNRSSSFQHESSACSHAVGKPHAMLCLKPGAVLILACKYSHVSISVYGILRIIGSLGADGWKETRRARSQRREIPASSRGALGRSSAGRLLPPRHRPHICPPPSVSCSMFIYYIMLDLALCRVAISWCTNCWWSCQ